MLISAWNLFIILSKFGIKYEILAYFSWKRFHFQYNFRPVEALVEHEKRQIVTLDITNMRWSGHRADMPGSESWSVMKLFPFLETLVLSYFQHFSKLFSINIIVMRKTIGLNRFVMAIKFLIRTVALTWVLLWRGLCFMRTGVRYTGIKNSIFFYGHYFSRFTRARCDFELLTAFVHLLDGFLLFIISPLLEP